MYGARGLILWVSYMPISVLTSRLQYGNETQQPIPVTGMTTGFNNRTGKYPARWEINSLQAEGGPRWDLYIQGLAALQKKTETDEQSHFGIAGIHGMPYAPYNGVGPVPGGSGGGFCPHGETQFIAWHRTYVALYEQTLGSEIQHIASDYGRHRNASAYREAALTFRLPYWDWATNPQLPLSCVQENITVNGPRGPLTLHNPLYSYKWQTYPLNQSQFPNSQNWSSQTTRASDGHGDFSPDVVNKNLADVAGQIKDQVYRTFAYAETYDQMASMADPAGFSFEAPHNLVHNAVGGLFASVDITAFDALFMLHHANVDRLAALWTAVHPDATHQSHSYASGGLYATAKGTNVTAGGPLKPFYRSDGKSFHTGLSVESIESFGYTYPELITPLKLRDPGQKKRIVVSRINKLYGTASSGVGGREWFAQVAVNRSELQLPCNIDIYVGDSFASRMALLDMPKHGVAHANIPLRRPIEGLGLNRGSETDRSQVESLLHKQLEVKVTKGNGYPIDANEVLSLELNLVVMDVTPHSSKSEFPKYWNKIVR
ncbi:Di-copper centre-containing protein [Hypomontagnella monticulosa]|nr:Di-copper centre-containing protein [Hypomontagnella monticulosa]